MLARRFESEDDREHKRLLLSCQHEFELFNLPDPPLPTHADLRSAEKAANRVRKQTQKYYGYRAVHPSWVGQQYYDLTLVSEEPVTLPKHQRRTEPDALGVVETEHEDLMNKLTDKLDFSIYWSLISFIHHAIVEAQTSGQDTATIQTEHEHETSTMNDTANDTTEDTTGHTYDATTSLAPLTHTYPLSTVLAGTNTNPPTHKLKLKLKTWTKADNFNLKEHFSGGPDIRHSKPRRIRERSSNHYDIVRLGRGQKQRGGVVREGREGKEYAALARENERWQPWLYPEKGRVIACCETWSLAQCCPWCMQFPQEFGEDEGGDEREGVDWRRDIADKAYGEEIYAGDDVADERSEALSMFESLLASSEIVIVSRPRSEAGDDDDDDSSSVGFDDMSDLADSIVDVEWEMLSSAGQSDSASVTGAEDLI